MGTIIVELSQYVLEALRKDEEFVLCRTSTRTSSSPSVLLLAPVSTRQVVETPKQLENEYSLRDELDSGWAVPLVLSGQRGQTPLVLEDAGGETLVRFLPMADGDDAVLTPHRRSHHRNRRIAQKGADS